jgi:integrase
VLSADNAPADAVNLVYAHEVNLHQARGDGFNVAMSLKIIPPRNSKTKNLYIRGTYLGVSVDKSCGTDKRSVAKTILKRIEGEIESGEYQKAKTLSPNAPTFLTAAIAYLEAGRRKRYIAKLIKYFGETPLSEINQQWIDKAAVALHPHASPATRNASVYTPVAAILHHAGVEIKVIRPKGAKGRIVTDWLYPEDASAIIVAADQINLRFAALLRVLLYTGLRLGEALAWTWNDLRLDEAAAWTRREKDGVESDVKLRADLVAALRALQPADGQGRVFPFRQGGHLKHVLTRAKLAALGLPCPTRRPVGWRPPDYRLAWVNFHTFRHTWATWMRKFGGLDVKGLVATNNWRDERSASRYAHAVASEEWNRVERLPAVGNIRGVSS